MAIRNEYDIDSVYIYLRQKLVDVSESMHYSTARCEDYGIIVRYAPVRFGKPLYVSYITRAIYISMYVYIHIFCKYSDTWSRFMTKIQVMFY